MQGSRKDRHPSKQISLSKKLFFIPKVRSPDIAKSSYWRYRAVNFHFPLNSALFSQTV